MANNANKLGDWILETIDQLRKRKARPDLERICHMVERKYGVSGKRTEAEIERLVDTEVVIKVDYKGNTSYRNAAKWGGKKNYSLSAAVLNSNEVSKFIVEAVRVLDVKKTTDDASAGVSVQEIEKYLLSQNTLTTLTKNKLRVALDREVAALDLLKLATGNYRLNGIKLSNNKSYSNSPAPAVTQTATAETTASPEPPAPPKEQLPKPPLPPRSTSDSNHSKVQIPPAKKGRPSNKRKRFKKTHGPDFVENYDASFEEPEPKCDYCLLTSACNSEGQPEELLFCKDCYAKAHPSCMDYTVELAARSRMSPWQCMHCKTCYVCNDSGDADSMLFCDSCDKGYHMSCHDPKVSKKPSGKWVCNRCVEEGKKKSAVKEETNEPLETTETDQAVVNTIDGAPGLPTPCESPVSETEQNKRVFSFILNHSLSDSKNGDEIPDASEWTIDDVEQYFRHVGFPEQASIFKEQEIDGKSLLLLKRSDVLTGLSFKLGPALKIYNHVKRLQTRRPDDHLIC